MDRFVNTYGFVRWLPPPCLQHLTSPNTSSNDQQGKKAFQTRILCRPALHRVALASAQNTRKLRSSFSTCFAACLMVLSSVLKAQMTALVSADTCRMLPRALQSNLEPMHLSGAWSGRGSRQCSSTSARWRAARAPGSRWALGAFSPLCAGACWLIMPCSQSRCSRDYLLIFPHGDSYRIALLF